MKKYGSLLLMLVLATFVMAPGWAQAGSGLYLSGDLGFNLSKSVSFEGASNDTWSQCDEYLNPDWDSAAGDLGGRDGCPAHQQSFEPGPEFFQDWWSDFDGGSGILAGAAVGYSFGAQNPNSPLAGFRVELEYFYRESKHDQTQKITRANKITQFKINAGEFGDDGPTERLGSITSHNIFGNVYYDFSNASRFTPYIGIGGGFGVTDADWGSNWTRTWDEDALRRGYRALATGSESLNDDAAKDAAERAALIHLADPNNQYINRLAQSSSNAQTSLSDTLWGLQILFGVDYAVTEAMSLGLKGRWVKFSSFSDTLSWNPLRSHPPYVRRAANGDPSGTLIAGSMSTSDIEFFGVSLNMKYNF